MSLTIFPPADTTADDVQGATSLTTANALTVVASAGTISQSTLKNNGGVLYPASDSTTAVQINKADGTTNVLNIDTTNGRVGIGTNAPSVPLQIGDGTTSVEFFRIRGAGGQSYFSFYNNTTRVGYLGSGASGANMIWNSDADLQIQVQNKQAFYMKNSGNGIVGIGPSNTSPTGTLHVYDATASTGVTTAIVQAGAGQSTTDLQQWKTNAGTVLVRVSSAGEIRATSVTSVALTVATLPATPVAGQRAFVSDSNATLTAGIGAVVTAGGANGVPVYFDGTSWRIG